MGRGQTEKDQVMRDIQKISAAALWTAAAAGLAGAALAEGGMGDMHGRGGMDLAGLFASLDADADGKVTEAEIEAAHAARFAAADSDKDGLLSSDELAQMHLAALAEKMAARSAAMMERMDSDGDGLLSPEEMTMGPGPAGMIERLDTDDDGAISQAEVEAMDMGRGGHGGMGHGFRGGHGGGIWGMFGGPDQ